MTRSLLLVLVVFAACGGKTPAKPTLDPEPAVVAPVADGRTAIEVRRDAACEALGPRITACAIEEARRTLSADELAKLGLEQTAPKHTEIFVGECKTQQLSSRQVRVYEVCMAEESACEPLIACLDNVKPTAAEGGAPP